MSLLYQLSRAETGMVYPGTASVAQLTTTLSAKTTHWLAFSLSMWMADEACV